MEIEVQHTTALSVSHRYAELIRLKEERERTGKQAREAAQYFKNEFSFDNSGQAQLFAFDPILTTTALL